MISVREAIEIAVKSGYEVFKKNGTVEEVELDGKYWYITLSFEYPPQINKTITDTFKTPTILEMLGSKSEPKPEIAYKIFKIDGESKLFVSAKMRKL